MAGYCPSPEALWNDPIVARGMNSSPKIVFSRTLGRADWANMRLVKDDLLGEVRKRMEKHKLGIGSRFVRSWRPFELVKTIPCRNAGEARRLEYDLKRLTRKKKIEVLGLQMSG
jgi:hypothetical protein